MHEFIKRIKRISIITIVTIVSLILLVYILLWIPSVQRKIVDIALCEVSKKTHNHMTIGDIRLRPFNSLRLHKVYAADQQGDTLLYVENLSAGFHLWSLLNSRLVIKSVNLDGFVVKLRRDSIGTLFNFQFFIDAFASGDTTDTSKTKLIVEIDDIRLANGSFSYDVDSEALRDSVFDASHIHLAGLRADISLSSINVKNLDVAVKQLSFRERSGLVLENLSATLTSVGEVMTLKDLELKLPRSLLNIPRATVDYTGIELSDLADSAAYSIQLDVPRFHLADLKAFSPFLTRFTDSIALRSAISGRFPAVKVDSFHLSYGSHIDVDIKASLANYVHWDSSYIELHPVLIVKPQGLNEITALTGNAPPIHTNGINLTADVAGTLPDLKLHVSAVSLPSGKLNIDGTGGYVFRTGQTHFALKLLADKFDLKTLLNNQPDLGLVSLTLEAAGDIDSTGFIDAKADLDIDRFDFWQYPYRNISASLSYAGKDVSLQLQSRDHCAPLLVRAKANLSDTPAASLYVKTSNLMPDKLNLTPQYKDADLFAVLKADVQGFNPERMIAALTLDSVRFTTSRGTANLDAIHLNYKASSDLKKQLELHSKIMTVGVAGYFSLNTIAQSVQNTLAAYFPHFVEPHRTPTISNDSLNIDISIRHTEQWADLLALPFAITDTAKLTVAYSGRKGHITVEANFPETKLNDMILRGSHLSLQADTIDRMLHLEVGTIRFGVADTMHLGLVVETLTDSLRLGAKFNVYTPQIKAGGELGLAAGFTKVANRKLPDISVHVLPAILQFNRQDVHIRQAHASMKGHEYEVDNFEITLSDDEYLKINGRVSRNEADTLRVSLAGIQIGTLIQAIGAGVNLTGEINGNIIANQLLTSPRILTDGFSIKDITFEKQHIGTLDLTSGWSKQLNALLVKAELSRDSARTSIITGTIFPQRDSLDIDADIRDFQLAWITPFTGKSLYGMKGDLGMRIKAGGHIKSPALSGFITMKNVNVGVNMLNVQYRISDSIQVLPDRLLMKSFRIIDEQNQQAVIDGEVQYTNFTDFRPALTMKLQNFLLLNNPKQTDSLFYGTLRMSGSVETSGSDKDLLVKVAVKNSSDSKLSVTLPEEQASEARQYKSVTFVKKDSTSVQTNLVINGQAMEEEMSKIPVKLQLAVEVTPELQLSAIYNPKTKDAATVKGSGKIDFTYNMANSNMSLLGEYKVAEGKCTVSFRNIATREFTIQPGGVVAFKGNPMATEFDVTAVYKLRADLLSLDPTVFEGVSRNRVNTECHIRVSGNMEKMNISYAITFPDEDESIQRKADALMATDEIKFKEMAYLLIAGTFYPAANTEPTKPTGDIWTSLASSAVTTFLNSMLDGVLSDNWTIGTELHSGDGGDVSTLEMDVIISTSLFNNRLIVSSNIGYKNTATTTSNTNFTGDFDVQYKLTKSGNVVLKVYNVTNDQYYEQAQSLTTQGVGLFYRREAKRFKDMFKRVKREK